MEQHDALRTVSKWLNEETPGIPREAIAVLCAALQDFDTEEQADMFRLLVELRDLLFDDANPTMQIAMVGSPIECLAFAKWWIQRAKGIEPDQSWFAEQAKKQIVAHPE